jgi:hypothetical protein
MRRRFSLLGVLGLLALAMVAPVAVTAGSQYTYVVTQNYCNGDKPVITVRMKKPAGAYPDRFQIVAQGQHRNIGGTRWSNESASSTFNKDVPSQYAKFNWTKSLTWNPPDSQWHRIKLRLKVIDNGSVVATATVNSVAC